MQEREHNSKVQLTSKIKYAVTVLTFFFVMVMNIGCSENKKGNPTENVSATPSLSSTKSITPTGTVTSTNTPTPTPTLIPYKTVKVNVDDLLMYDIVIGDFFGEKEDFEQEFEKRKDYLKAFNVINDDEATILLAFMNEMKYNRKYSRLIGETVKEKYLAYCTEENVKKLPDICYRIMAFNVDNPGNQIVFSFLGIDGIALGAKERVTLNEVQKVMCEVTNGHTFNLSKIDISDYNQTRKYWIKTSDGERIEVAIDTDILNNVCKYFVCAMQTDVLSNISQNTDNKDIINAYNNATKHLDSTADVLLDLERLIEITNGLTGKYYYNVYYDPNSDDYHTWNPYYDMVIPDQEPIEEKVKVKF